MIKYIGYIIVITTFFLSCKKEKIYLSSNAKEVFWVSSNGADMPVWVEGNTLSKTFILFVHGGPGLSSYVFSDRHSARITDNYAMVLWDQRNSGGASGNAAIKELTLDLMVSDLENITTVLKHRYGSDIKLFLYGHSFGGLLGSAFLIKGNNQYNFRGWIEVAGAHNYPLTNMLSKQMLIDTGNVEISRGNNLANWTEAVNYCNQHDPSESIDVSYTINDFAHQAEIDMNVDQGNTSEDFFSPISPIHKYSNLFNMYKTQNGKKFIQSLETVTLSNELYKITIPTLLMWGKYDFVVPLGLAYDAYQNIGSADKTLVVFQKSGHRPMVAERDLFETRLILFIENHK